MTLRTRLLLAFGAVVLVPLALLAYGYRQEVSARLRAEYEEQLASVAAGVEIDLQREAAGIQERLASVAVAMPDDNRLRAGLTGVAAERPYLLEWAGTAMRLTGLSLLQLHDAEGRIVSSGHFRNDHGRVDARLITALETSGDRPALLLTPSPEGERLAIVRHAPVRIADRTLTLVGGVAVDTAFLTRLAGRRDVSLTLRHPAGTLTSPDQGGLPADDSQIAARELQIAFIRSGAAPDRAGAATLTIVQSRASLTALLRDVDSWFLLTAGAATLVALLLAAWVASRISRPIARLADQTAVLDLDRLDVEFSDSRDEVGTLARVLGDLAARLRTSTVRVRDAERRATIGDLARQVNHDIRNGLVPLRNVMRHLSQVAHSDPSALAGVLEARKATIDSSIGYLETLATNYERLSSAARPTACDVHALIVELTRAAAPAPDVELQTELLAADARIYGDPVAVRRILENLVTNAIDSLEGRPGRVTIATAQVDAEEGRLLRIAVADTGRGLSPDEAARIFEGFYTTKAHGTGLGLSIVRRLVTDLHGSVRVESEPGVGTRMIVEVPTVGAAPRPAGAAPDNRAAASREGRRRW
jgi:signal transduction histidine kinase